MADITAETAITPTETVTPKPETGDGTPIDTGQPLRTLETAEQRIKELNAENLRLRKQSDAAAKAKSDAEAAAMAEQGKFKELYQSAKAKADAPMHCKRDWTLSPLRPRRPTSGASRPFPTQCGRLCRSMMTR
jgi:hypothetical protein